MRNWFQKSLLLASLALGLATPAHAIRVHSELIGAQLENKASDYATGVTGRVWYNTTEGKAKLDKGATIVELGAGSSSGGGTNFVTNPDAETNATNCTAYADAAATSPVDGTGGSPTITCTRTTSSPLTGTGSFLITKDAANRQGEGVAFPFTIDRAQLAKVQTVSFDYEIPSGTYDAGSDTTDPDLTAWVYGPTDGTPALTQLAAYKVLGQASGSIGRFQGQFQTAASGVAYRLILHEAKTGTSAYTLKLDSVTVGPDRKSYGPPVSDWVTSSSCTGSWTNTTYTCKERRVGDSLEVQQTAILTGTPGAGNLTFTIPGGRVIDTAKMNSVANEEPWVGFGTLNDNGSARLPGFARYNTTTTVVILSLDDPSYVDAPAVSEAAPFTWAVNDRVHMNYRVPIVGWSSNVQVSSDAGAKPITARIRMSANQNVVTGAVTKLNIATSDFDSHGTLDAGNNRWIAPQKDRIQVGGQVLFSGIASSSTIYVQTFLYKNGSEISSNYLYYEGTAGTDPVILLPPDIVDVVAGDYLEVFVQSNDGSYSISSDTKRTFLTLASAGFGQQITAHETVAAVYTYAGGLTISGSYQTLPFAVQVRDTHGKMTTGASALYTIPSPGLYRIYCEAKGPNSTSEIMYDMEIRQGSTQKAYKRRGKSATTNGTLVDVEVEATLPLVAGDTVDCRMKESPTSVAGTVSDAMFSIVRVGN